jgi:hypothetical protein
MEGIDPADGSSQVAFSADGTTLTLLSSGGRVQRWDLLLGSGKDSELLADTGEALGGYTLSQQGTLTALPDQAYRLGKLREAGRGAAEFESTARSYLRRLFLPVKP